MTAPKGLGFYYRYKGEHRQKQAFGRVQNECAWQMTWAL